MCGFCAVRGVGLLSGLAFAKGRVQPTATFKRFNKLFMAYCRANIKRTKLLKNNKRWLLKLKKHEEQIQANNKRKKKCSRPPRKPLSMARGSVLRLTVACWAATSRSRGRTPGLSWHVHWWPLGSREQRTPTRARVERYLLAAMLLVEPVYIDVLLHDDPMLAEALTPSLQVARTVKCLVGCSPTMMMCC